MAQVLCKRGFQIGERPQFFQSPGLEADLLARFRFNASIKSDFEDDGTRLNNEASLHPRDLPGMDNSTQPTTA